MRALLVVVIWLLAPSLTQAQERWQRLSGAASSYQVDLQSLIPTDGVLRARIQTNFGNQVMVEELEVRCAAQESRTLAQSEYDNDTGKPIPTSARQEADTFWINYPPGSEGHAIVASLCALGHERKLLGNAARLDV
jgi:hypothetical protein